MSSFFSFIQGIAVSVFDFGKNQKRLCLSNPRHGGDTLFDEDTQLFEIFSDDVKNLTDATGDMITDQNIGDGFYGFFKGPDGLGGMLAKGDRDHGLHG